MEYFYMGVAGLCYMTATPHLHFLQKYCNKLTDENLLWLAAEEHPVSIFPFSKLL
jgi:hypothetical protein